VYTEFSNLAKGKTFMLALLRHKAGLTHTLDGRLQTRDESTRILPHKVRDLELILSYLYVS